MNENIKTRFQKRSRNDIERASGIGRMTNSIPDFISVAGEKSLRVGGVNGGAI